MTGFLPAHLFCTADIPAIHALVLIGLSEQGISLESLLKSEGLHKKLQRNFTDPFFRDQFKKVGLCASRGGIIPKFSS